MGNNSLRFLTECSPYLPASDHKIKSKGLKAFVLSSNKLKFYIFSCVMHTNNSILLLQ